MKQWESIKRRFKGLPPCSSTNPHISTQTCTPLSLPLSLYTAMTPTVRAALRADQSGIDDDVFLADEDLEEIFRPVVERVLELIGTLVGEVARRGSGRRGDGARVPPIGVSTQNFEQTSKTRTDTVDDKADVRIHPAGDKQKIDRLFLVGGFSASPYLRRRIRERFRNHFREIVSPPDAGSAVVQGAVHYGVCPSLISARCSRYTYGILLAMRLDTFHRLSASPSNPPSHKKDASDPSYPPTQENDTFYHPERQVTYIVVFQPFVRRGEIVPRAVSVSEEGRGGGAVVMRGLEPVFEEAQKADVEIFALEDDKDYEDEAVAGCNKRVCSVYNSTEKGGGRKSSRKTSVPWYGCTPGESGSTGLAVGGASSGLGKNNRSIYDRYSPIRFSAVKPRLKRRALLHIDSIPPGRENASETLHDIRGRRMLSRERAVDLTFLFGLAEFCVVGSVRATGVQKRVRVQFETESSPVGTNLEMK
ncbi:hypothetical protein HK102_001317 [Quaeritorhiza haematococci]|nr:hypothetical protein HK102_001317 [Quaeritorhiza haematococci]